MNTVKKTFGLIAVVGAIIGTGVFAGQNVHGYLECKRLRSEKNSNQKF